MPTKYPCSDEVTFTALDGSKRTYNIPSLLQPTDLSIEIKNSQSFQDAWDEVFNKGCIFNTKASIPNVKRIVYHDPATIVFWQDGTKTVVKCMDGEPFEKYAGFCAALAKKVFGSTSKAKKVAGAKKKDGVEE